MSDDGSDTSSLDERPVYFKVFTRESLLAIRERAEEEAIRLKEEEAKKAAEEVSIEQATYSQHPSIYPSEKQE